ncbi:acetate--CoA ligase family protein [Candidatus Daviesbacteria bacterium]|nr:acetate--CoA ligase family protein [Candidatus Daviesbacteria bacterium]
MILYEYEGKKLLKDAGINIPNFQLIESSDLDSSGFALRMTGEVVLKAQVLSGKRADAGGIIVEDSIEGVASSLKDLFSKVINKEKVEKVLVEEKVDIAKEYYVSLSYDTDTRGPVLNISNKGGIGIEERGVKSFPVDPITQSVILSESEGSNLEILHGVYPRAKRRVQNDILEKLINLFFEQDCLLLEINPLVKTKNGWVALDAKIKLDDSAIKRHEEWQQYPPRAVPGYTPSDREIEAKKIDEEDYRGVAGSTYFDFDGDIAVLASGGGASLTAMDALFKIGGKPANYTEYSGNPPKEKVEKLTQIVLSKPNLNGLWVVGGVANFTDIYETLSGFLDALRKITSKPDYPIVIRRGGPRDEEAFEMLKKVKDFDLHLYGQETSIAESAKVIVDLAKEYAQRKNL